MEKNLYIDASHPSETRVVLKSNSNIEDYEYESLKTNLNKNNIYLGKVSRIEPSLQAAFIDFGKERHGFLSFNDIQSDYYQIPKSDLKVIKEEEEKVREELSKEKEAKEDENLAEGNLEIDDPIEKNENENQALKREVLEETNLEINSFYFLNSFKLLYRNKYYYRHVFYSKINKLPDHFSVNEGSGYILVDKGKLSFLKKRIVPTDYISLSNYLRVKYGKYLF